MTRGTPFKPGQLAKVQGTFTIAAAKALPTALESLDPKKVIAALDGRGAVLARRLESAFAGVIGQMLVLKRHPRRVILISNPRDPELFFTRRPGLWIYDGFRDLVARAFPLAPGAVVKFDEDELGEELSDLQILRGLPKNPQFEESILCAILAELIETNQLDKKCVYLLYTDGIVTVRWSQEYDEWLLDESHFDNSKRQAGLRVLSYVECGRRHI